MRKEISGLILIFIVIFTLVSLLTYSPSDPSVHNATPSVDVHNRFGIVGAQTAGILVGLFGVAAFWIPIFLFLWSFHLFKRHDTKTIAKTMMGGMILLVSTGGILALSGDHIMLSGRKFSSGGIIGIPFKSFLTTYSNQTGAILFLILFAIVGLILALRFSIARFAGQCWRTTMFTKDGISTWLIKWRERRKKLRKKKIAQKKTPTQSKKKVKITTLKTSPIKQTPIPKQQEFDFMHTDGTFQLPSANFLDDPGPKPQSVNDENLRMMSKRLEKKLCDFGVKGSVITVTPGPVITTFEYKPAPGIKINKIVGLADDLALALRALSIRVVAPIPGKAVIGIEIPNTEREIVRFKEIVISPEFEISKSKLTICLGKDIIGKPVVTELEKMPHLLIAGATGTGKSVGINTMICSLLYKSTPEEIKLIMVDPKRIELSMYDDIPHLISPVVTDVKKATHALYWAVREMERRYELLAKYKVRNIGQYNRKIKKKETQDKDESSEVLPLIVIIIDELADLMMVASKDVESSLTRLAQMARAAGIHLILATQRPSVDVLTGIIKANFPTRLTFQVSSRTDSRTIIDGNGAENLLGNGDMLLLPPGTARLQRVHGAYISEREIARITDYLKSQRSPDYNENVTKIPEKEADLQEDIEYDEKYDEALALVTKTRQASISGIQRYLRIGYNRAARIIETMEKEGVVGPSDGAKPREVLVPGYEDRP